MIPEIASAIGQGAQSLQNLAQTGWQMDFNRDESKKARDFNFMMATRKYQLAMADMRAAGLNPMLAASGGGFSPASASAGAASIGGMSSAPDYLEGTNRTKRTEQDIKHSDQMIKQSEALADQIAANERFLDEKANTERIQQDFLKSQKNLVDANTLNASQQFWKIAADIDYVSERLNTEKSLQEMYRSNARSTNAKTEFIDPLASFLRGADISTMAQDVGEVLNPNTLIHRIGEWFDKKMQERFQQQRGTK